MLLNRMSDGPAVGIPPSQEHAFAQFPSQSLLDTPNGFHGCSSSKSAFAPNGSTAFSFGSSNPSAFVPPQPSRKRSRDEASFDEVTTSAPPIPKPTPTPKWEPIYGEGMVLLNPQTGMAVSAESQTGTWYEETAETQAAANPPVSSRSIALHSDAADVSRKAQRLDVSAPGLDDIALSSMQQRLNGSEMADQHRTLNGGGSTPPNEPLIDDATRLLGISWQRIDNDADIAPAIRGWTKYIDNQYAAYLRNSQMLLKSRALNAYLVTATPVSSFSPTFYLFNEDLTQAQLVASTWDSCIQNLRSTPVVFEGTMPVAAASQSSSPSATPFTAAEAGVPLLQQALANQPKIPAGSGMGLNGGVGMGMEIDS